MTVAADHESTVAGRNEELKVLREAKQVLLSTTSGAEAQSYSMLQLAESRRACTRFQTRTDLANAEVVTLVKRLAQEHHSAALAQLASRIEAVARYGAADGADPFAKVKGLISDLIAKLEAEAAAEATEKAFCDDQMAKTEFKQTELEDDIAKLTLKIDQASAASVALKAEVKQLQADLARIAKEQAEMDKVREESHAAYVKAKADLELGLTGVREALQMLRGYYGGGAAAAMLQAGDDQPAPPVLHEKATGAGQSIIGILEVVESDFAKNLAEEEQEEADAEAEYQKMTQENKVTTTLKSQDAKYKTQEFVALDKAIGDLSSDRETANSELTAVNEYYGKIKERCIAKPETYEERQARRTAEINGLKEALAILEDETAFMQRGKRGLPSHFLGASHQ